MVTTRKAINELSSSLNAEIKPGATVIIPTLETVGITEGHCAIVGIRNSLGNHLQIDAQLIRGNYHGTLNLYVRNKGVSDFCIRKGDRIANIACIALASSLEMLVVNQTIESGND